MSKRIKLIIFALVTCMVFVMLGLVACKTDTYKVTYVYGNGEDNVVVTVKNGDTLEEPTKPVRDGYTFDYWYLSDAETPFVFDSFIITGDITLTAHWTSNGPVVPPVNNTSLTWDSGDYAEFLIVGMSGTQLNSVRQGAEIVFQLRVSPYCTGTAVVKADEQVVNADKDGWYMVVAQGTSMTISVTGLVEDTTPIKGLGTKSKPYVLTTPSQYKTFTDAVNDESNTKYNSAYVALGADLSFNGAELTPIGIAYGTAHFEGVFDGRGHTLSDFTMRGVGGLAGLFGYVVTGEVSNVHVRNTVYDIDAVQGTNIAGGIVAYNMGSDVIGCSISGDVVTGVDSASDVYLGGIVGFAQGYSTTNSATVSYCTSNVNFKSTGSYPLFAVGGIVGITRGTADSAPVAINNCIYDGAFSGNILLAGGAIGYMRDISSIANCYTKGNIVATNTLSYAIAGAFAGMAEQNTAITNSYSTATYSATHSPSYSDVMTGAIKSDFVGCYDPDGDKTDSGAVDSKEILILNSYVVRNGQVVAKGKYDAQPTTDFTDFTAVKSLLKWNDSEWNYENNTLQVAVDLEQGYQLNYTITFNFGDKTVNYDGKEIVNTDVIPANRYVPLDWIYEGNGENTFKATDNTISYGLFLDEEHTVRLPAAMLMTSDMTVYVAFSEYWTVAGDYYLADIYGDQVVITLDDNGTVTMNYGGMIEYYKYVYDGDRIVIKDSHFAYLYYDSNDDNVKYANFYADIQSDRLVIYDNYYYADSQSIKCLYAYKGNVILGNWYDAEQAVYTFKVNGKGSKLSSDDETTSFTYTIDGDAVTITIGGVTYNVTLSSNGRNMATGDGETMLSLDRFDIYAGDWETDFNNNITVSFDGKNELTVNGEKYGYTVDDDGVVTYEKGRAEVSENGLIDFTYDGNSYVLVRAHSYRGVWVDTRYGYVLVFAGIGVDGYGYGYDSQDYDFTYVVSQSNSDPNVYAISLYYGTARLGYGKLIVNQNGEEGLSMVCYYDDISNYGSFTLNYYDPLQGVWGGDDGTLYSFNGFGAYDTAAAAAGETIQWSVKGEVTVTDGDNESTVKYIYNRHTATATFTYNEQDYTVKIDAQGNLHFVVDGDKQPLYAPDMYEDVLLVSDNHIFYFDGWSTINHGVVLYWDGDTAHDQIEYSYSLNEDGTVITVSNEQGTVYTLTLDPQSGFMVMDNADNTELGLYSLLGGNTYIAPDGSVMEVGNFNLLGIAFGTMFGDEATFEYVSEYEAAVYIDGELAYYLTTSYLYYDNVNLYYSDGVFITMLVVPDDMLGKYAAQDGSYFEFDGRSYIYKYYAVVDYVDKDGSKVIYYYVQNEDGTYSIFDVDRTGDYDVHVEYYVVYTSEHQGAVKYVSEDGVELWIVDVQAMFQD